MKPVDRLKNRMLAEWGGYTIQNRNKRSITFQHPTDPTRFAVDHDIGALHYGPLEDQEIDTAWIEDAQDGFTHAMLTNDFITRVKTSVTSPFNSGNIFRFEKNGEWLIFDPQSLSWIDENTSRQQIAIKQAVVGSFSDDVVTFANAYGTGIDFSYHNETARLAKLITIDQFSRLPTPTVQGNSIWFEAEFSMSLSSGITFWINGIEWTKENGVRVQTANNIEIRDATGTNVLWYLGLPRAWDSSTDNIPNETIGQLEVRRQGGPSSLFITIRIPYTWMQSAIYPVYVDPTIDDQVGASDDDAAEFLGNGSVNTTNAYVPAGDNGYGCGVHFSGVNVPNGATINVSYLDLYIQSTTWDSPNHTWTGDDSDNAGAFVSGTTYDISGRTDTTASVNWSPGNNIGVGFHNTSSFNAIIQEIVDRTGWASGNDMAFICMPIDNGRGYFQTYDGSTTNCSKLHIEYTENSGITGTLNVTLDNTTVAGTGSLGRLVHVPNADWRSYLVDIVTPGTSSDWDEVFWGGAAGAPVYYNNKWYMYYCGAENTGGNGDEFRAIGLVTSTDWFNWTKHASNPLIQYTTTSFAQDEEGASNPVVMIEGGTWHMWYAASIYTGPSNVDVNIRYRTSTDGITWTGDTLVYSASGEEYAPIGVFKNGSTYYLLILGDLTSGKGPLNYISGTTPSSLSGKTLISNASSWSGVSHSVNDMGDGIVSVMLRDDIPNGNYEWYYIDKSAPSTLSSLIVEYNNVNYQATYLYKDPNHTWYDISMLTGKFQFRSTGPFGYLDTTLDDVTAVGTGDLDLAGTLGTTLDDVTVAATGDLDITGTLSETLDDLTLAATGTVTPSGIAGALAVTLDDLTLAATGDLDITGTLNVILDEIGTLGTGDLVIVGSASSILDDVSIVASGYLDIQGTLSSTLDDLTISGSGTLIPGVTGALSVVLDGINVSSNGELLVSGALNSTLDDVVAVGTGEIDIEGVSTVILDGVNVYGTGILLAPNTGVLNVALDGVSIFSVGDLYITGLFAKTLDGVTVYGYGAKKFVDVILVDQVDICLNPVDSVKVRFNANSEVKI